MNNDNKEPENNTDHRKMDKIKCGRDTRNKWNEGSIKPHLPREQLSTDHQHSNSIFQDSGNFVEMPVQPSSRNKEAHTLPELSWGISAGLCPVCSVPGRQLQPGGTARV